MAIAKLLKPTYITLEIGTGKGGTSWFISHARADGGISTVDIEDKSKEPNITDCHRDGNDPCNIRFYLRDEFKREAVERLNRHFFYDLIVVDGDHSYDGVLEDLVAYLPLLRVGGYLYMHDTDQPGVAQAIKERLTEDDFTLCEEHLPPTPGAAGWAVYQRQFAYSYIKEE